MESTPINTPPPAPAPPPPPAPPPATPVHVPPPPDYYQQGGETPSNVKFNWVEIGVLVLGVTGIYYIIHYYRKKTQELRESSSTIAQLTENVDQIKHEFNGMKQAAIRHRQFQR